MTILIAVLITAIAVAIVAWPIVRGRHPAPTKEEVDPELAELLARREAMLTAIKDLEFDHAVGKIEEKDFQVLNARLRAEAIQVLKELDRYLGSAMEDLDAQLEAEIARRRRQIPDVAALEAQIEAEIAALRERTPTTTPSSDGRICPRCGSSLDADDRFCSQCGAPVASPQAG